MKEYTNLLHGLKITSVALNVKYNSSLIANSFKELARFSSGVYMVHLSKRGIVEHIIAVDASRGLISYKEEPCKMNLS